MKQEVYTHGRQIVKQITYSDLKSGTNTITVAKLPIGSRVKVNVTINEAFDNSNKINIGTSTATNKLIKDFDMVDDIGETSIIVFEITANNRELIATINDGATAGALSVTVDFMLPTTEEVDY